MRSKAASVTSSDHGGNISLGTTAVPGIIERVGCAQGTTLVGGSLCSGAPPTAHQFVHSSLPLCSLIGASCLQRGGCERERGDDVMLTSSVRCGSFRHASNGPNGTILRPVTSVGGRTRYRRIRRGFLAGESRVVVTLLSLNPLLATPGAQRSRCLPGRH
jgi:hypothetical protein